MSKHRSDIRLAHVTLEPGAFVKDEGSSPEINWPPDKLICCEADDDRSPQTSRAFRDFSPEKTISTIEEARPCPRVGLHNLRRVPCAVLTCQPLLDGDPERQYRMLFRDPSEELGLSI